MRRRKLCSMDNEEKLEIEKLKLEQKAKIQQTEQAVAKPPSKSNVIMPKLIITKYNNTYEKWLSFWNKIEAEIDSSDLPVVTKFAHPKELLESNVCKSINSLPFASEGYQHAKNILTSNHGKISKIVRAYIDNLNVQSRQCGLLGLKWDKLSDKIGVPFPANVAQPTKRGILRKVTTIYDPLGLPAATTLQGKLPYHEACEEKCTWDGALSAELVQQCKKLENCLPQQINCPRTLMSAQQPVDNIELHAFGDAWGKGIAAAVYTVIEQPTSVNQGLVTAKARLAKQGLPYLAEN